MMVKIFRCFHNFSAGVQFFVPEDETAYASGKPCHGFGSVRYYEGSVYYGQLYFDGEQYNKIGFGRQDFLLSSAISTLEPFRKIRKAFFIGQFDYRKTDWIYGNGVLYYVNEDNRPACFKKGFFEGLTKIAEYEGEFDPSTLADGFTPDMERDFDEWTDMLTHMLERSTNVVSLENLWIGDSYFELWDNAAYLGAHFYDAFDNATNLNIGVGGTRFCDWLRFIKDLDELPAPKQIFLNLGFNDIHSGFSAECVFGSLTEFLKQFRARFPYAEYVLLNVVKAPNYPNYYEEEEKFNAMTREAANRLNVKIVDMRTQIEHAGGINQCFHVDGIHLNARGYQAYSALIRKYMK